MQKQNEQTLKSRSHRLLIEIFFSVKEERTSRHGITLAKKQCRLDIRKFSQRTVNEWNRLSADCVGASSALLRCRFLFLNMFKNKNRHLRRAAYI